MHFARLLSTSAALMAFVATAWATSPPVVCTAVADSDIVGFDLASSTGNRTSCGTTCAAKSGCVTWTWSEYNSGTCWLKSHKGKLVEKKGVWAWSCADESKTTVCNAYADIDFVGMDIANKPGNSFGDCCDICNEFSGCTAYAWNNYQNGTCWLKSSVGHVVARAGVTSSSTILLYGPVCPFEYDMDFPGNDIGSKPANDAGVCCTLCKGNKDCKAYSWSNFNGGTCWMKSARGKAVPAPGVISAAIVG